MNDSATHTDHPFGILNLWSQGDAVTRSIAIILLVMSIVSWIIIVSRAWGLWKMKPIHSIAKQFWQKNSFQEAIESLPANTANPYLDLANAANRVVVERQAHSSSIAQSVDAQDWLERCLKEQLETSTSGLQKGLAFLASTGSISPFIGLFGTVWGIYHALMSIGSSGSASIDQVAGPIGEALIMTGLGLAVAIPAVLGFNAISKSNRSILVELRRFADDLHTYLTQSKKV
jgi:biopolymer transport protein ExbB